MTQTPRFLPATGYDPVNAKKRVRSIVSALRRAYPTPRTALTYKDPFELLVATILSAQCTDEVVNKVTPKLFQRYSTPQALASANPADVEAIIRPTGFFRQKTKSIIATALGIVERFGGEVPGSLSELTTLRGVARKTANVVLANCYPRPASDHGIFVDTHIRRISQRLALTDKEDPVKVEQDLMALLPEDLVGGHPARAHPARPRTVQSPQPGPRRVSFVAVVSYGSVGESRGCTQTTSASAMKRRQHDTAHEAWPGVTGVRISWSDEPDTSVSSPNARTIGLLSSGTTIAGSAFDAHNTTSPGVAATDAARSSISAGVRPSDGMSGPM